ncbi:TPA: hypothetical protein N0F65_005362 [Lagenidium giganteum]|uniref:phosphopyruvate hydratase n=1 Tax=Lagenidium giganteum TaxID=4803 RepID=A0AAV2YMP4_9STRA|nr:TPA: hypothetical protein N0F65_005362 [Lagenidium giganteum]
MPHPSRPNNAEGPSSNQAPLRRGVRHASTIQSIHAREIIDSRGNPTVEVDLKLSTSDEIFRASVPSGASTGIHEAVELRDGGKRYLGKGVLQAVNNVKNVLAPKLIGMDPTKQREIDSLMRELDGTENKGKLGANAILGVSLAVAKAGASANGVPLFQHFADLIKNDNLVLPVPAFNVINGGSHAGNKLAFQEFMILPTGASSFSEAMVMGCEVYHHLKNVIKKKYGQDATNVGDEGGFAPNIQSNREGVELLMSAIEKAGYSGKVKIGMDVASSEFYTEDHKYDLDFKSDSANKQILTGEELSQLYQDLAREFPIVSIEDPFDQDDWKHYSSFTAAIGKQVQVVGDDLLCTNPKRIATALDKKACNALLLKVNQIGSVSESVDAVALAQQNGWGVMTSHRSGETEDSYIADLAVGLSTGQIKTGAPCRSERLAKYNQLLRIEEQLGRNAKYAGEHFRTPSFQGSVYYGWLWKRGASFKTWKKRFFLLHGCTLTYYTQCCVISTDQTGTRCLDLPAKGGLRVASAELSELTSFGVMVKSSSGRVLHLQAGYLDSRMQWVKVLQEAPEKKTTPPSTTRSAPDIRCTTGSDFNGSVYLASGSVDLTSFQSSLSTMSDDDSVEQSDVTDMRGWLNVRGSLFMGWKKRYVTLVDGHVTVLTRARKRKPQDKSSEEFTGPVFHGWLWKRVPKYSTWKPRYFLLHNVTLTYYSEACVIISEEGTQQCVNARPRGGLRIAHAEPSNVSSFGIKVTSCSGQVVHLQCQDQDSRSQWLRAMQEAPHREYIETMLTTRLQDTTFLDTATECISPVASYHSMDDSQGSSGDEEQGWVKLRGSLLNSWKKCYLHLGNGRLTVTKANRRHDFEDCKESLLVVSVNPSRSKSDTFHVLVDGNKKLTIRAASEIEACKWIHALRTSLGITMPYSCMTKTASTAFASTDAPLKPTTTLLFLILLLEAVATETEHDTNHRQHQSTKAPRAKMSRSALTRHAMQKSAALRTQLLSGAFDDEENTRKVKQDELPIHGNETTYNLNTLLHQNILQSSYFHQLYNLKTYHEVVDEIYNRVDHAEPLSPGTSRIPSTCFCLLLKCFSMRLTMKQMQGLLKHTDSPFIRVVGFLYLRYTCDPKDLWGWFEPYLDDPEEFNASANPSVTTTIGEWLRGLLEDNNYFSTILPRIPKKTQDNIKVRLLLHSRKKEREKENLSIVEFLKPGVKVRATYADEDNEPAMYDAVIDSVEEGNQFWSLTKSQCAQVDVTRVHHHDEDQSLGLDPVPDLETEGEAIEAIDGVIVRLVVGGLDRDRVNALAVARANAAVESCIAVAAEAAAAAARRAQGLEPPRPPTCYNKFESKNVARRKLSAETMPLGLPATKRSRSPTKRIETVKPPVPSSTNAPSSDQAPENSTSKSSKEAEERLRKLRELYGDASVPARHADESE